MSGFSHFLRKRFRLSFFYAFADRHGRGILRGKFGNSDSSLFGEQGELIYSLLNQFFAMKTLYSIALVGFMALCSTSALATVWRVNNNSTSPATSTDFTSVTTALNSASVQNGDTLYVEGSPASYGSITINKRVTIIGTGYFLTDNDTTQANTQRSRFSIVTVNAGGLGTVLTGLDIDASSSSWVLTINADSVVVDRCYIRNTTSTSSPGGAILVSSNRSGVEIKRSFLDRPNNSTSCCSTPRVTLEILDGCSNIVVDNNIIKNGPKGQALTSYDSWAIRMGATATAIVRNNVINGRVQIFNSIFNNNIMIAGTGSSAQFNATMVSIQNNIGNSTQFGTTNGNQSNVNMTDVFEYGPGNENVDNHYVLKAGSPAIGAGVSGVDCGAFGGSQPYVLSGMPAIPAIFEVTLGSNVVTSSSGLQLNTKSKAHD